MFVYNKKGVPGPASTVEERSLRNISSEGTAVRISPRGLYFSVANLFAKMIDGNLQRNRTSYILSRNLDSESCCDQNSTVRKGT